MLISEDEARRQRLIATAQIENRLIYFASEVGLQVSEFVWNLGQGMAFPGSHRLDFTLCDVQVRMYFLEQELIDYATNPHCSKLDARLEDVIDAVIGIDVPPVADIYMIPASSHRFQ